MKKLGVSVGGELTILYKQLLFACQSSPMSEKPERMQDSAGLRDKTLRVDCLSAGL